MKYILDVDASKVIEAARSTGVTITPAMMHYAHYLISNMKNIGTWQLSNAVYGFVGGTAASHKWNWKDLRDDDAAFRLTFEGGGWVHSINGIKGNGTSSYANTFFNPSVSVPNVNSVSLSIFTDGSSDVGGDISLSNVSPSVAMTLNSKFSAGGNASSQIYGGVTNALNSASLAKGFFIGNRKSSTSNQLWRNGVILAENTTLNPITSLVNLNGTIKISCLASTTIGQSSFTSRMQQYINIGSGLTDTQAQQQSQIVTNAQAILNRL